MLKRIIYALRWRRVFNRTKRQLHYRATTRALILAGVFRRVA